MKPADVSSGGRASAAELGPPAEDGSDPGGSPGRAAFCAPASSAASTEVAAENAAWIRDLPAGGILGDQARRQLFDFLVRAASVEARWRSSHMLLSGPELEDLAQQAAADAMITIVDKLETFRGDCRFTTWAYRFAALIVGSKVRRHPWHRPNRPFHTAEWLDYRAWCGDEPEVDFEAREMQSVIRRVVTTDLTPHQREVLIASIIDHRSADDLATQLGSNRNAIYKVLFDARQKLKVALRAEGFSPPSER